MWKLIITKSLPYKGNWYCKGEIVELPEKDARELIESSCAVGERKIDKQKAA
jgi:hypothetical protein